MMQLTRDRFMMCMVRKACHKEEGMVVLPTLGLPSCRLMTCSKSSLEIILTSLDQQDLMIHSFVRNNFDTTTHNNIINTLADVPRMGRGKGHSSGFASFGNDFGDMGFGSFGSGGSAFSSFRYQMIYTCVYLVIFV